MSRNFFKTSNYYKLYKGIKWASGTLNPKICVNAILGYTTKDDASFSGKSELVIYFLHLRKKEVATSAFF
ncbi:Uncharacterised protein [Legionella oakridgensis]|nr:hypothetical protein LLB_2521 [Legionella longbeachae D-4968]VEE03741.1 Uncharacterised protein [Legionella oakridgensis]